jgi:predicted amidophosphoribosyltransferase
MTDGILNWKRCKKCGKFFDISTNYNLCPRCRKPKKCHKEIHKNDKWRFQ